MTGSAATTPLSSSKTVYDTRTCQESNDAEAEEIFPLRAREKLENEQILRRATKCGRLACSAGIASDVLGGVVSASGWAVSPLQTTPTKHRVWFCIAIAAWIIMIVIHAVLLWEVMDRLKRHSQKFVARCRTVYFITAGICGFLLALLSIVWAWQGSFQTPESSSSTPDVLLMLNLVLLFGGIGTSICFYAKYNHLVAKSRTYSARLHNNVAKELTRQLSRQASKAGSFVQTAARHNVGSFKSRVRKSSRASTSTGTQKAINKDSTSAHSLRSNQASKSENPERQAQNQDPHKYDPGPSSFSSSDVHTGSDTSADDSFSNSEPDSKAKEPFCKRTPKRPGNPTSSGSTSWTHPTKRTDELFFDPSPSPLTTTSPIIDDLSSTQKGLHTIPRKPLAKKTYQAYRSPSFPTRTPNPSRSSSTTLANDVSPLPLMTRTDSTNRPLNSRREDKTKFTNLPCEDEGYNSDSGTETSDEEIIKRLSRKYSNR